MVEKKPHLFFRNPKDEPIKYNQPVRFVGKDEEESEKNYSPMKDDFIRLRREFFINREIRIQNRNQNLKVPTHIEFIELHFFDAFNSSKFENTYRKRFGLAPVFLKRFNGIGIFAIIDFDLFNHFIEQLNIFIESENPSVDPTFDKHILFIKEFYFLSTDRIIEFPEQKEYIILNILKNPELYQTHTQEIEQSLENYLKTRKIIHYFNKSYDQLEIVGISNESLIEIVNNFDIIHTVNSYSAGIIRPSPFNTPIREYGFSISNSDEELPVIGIIDTGISKETPLAPLVLNRADELNITATSTLIDEADHGTAVAQLASMGDRLINNHLGEFDSDAKLLSIKTMNTSSGIVEISEIERLIREANTNYNCKIFTLTILYSQPLKSNAMISEYAYVLDKLSYELDILIFISAGNCSGDSLIEDIFTSKIVEYPTHFCSNLRTICSPADSYNNIVIGAISDNFENNDLAVFTTGSQFPASYTRKYNFEFNDVISNSKRISKHLSKPDIALAGGDYDNWISPEFTGLKVISNQTGIFFDRECGTSLSAPLAANLAAKLLKLYPDLKENMQSVKALIINSSNCPTYGGLFDNFDLKSRMLIGKGIPDSDKLLFSNEDSITILLEDSIKPDQVQTYNLNVPEYIQNLQHPKNVIEVTATICYKILPTQETHITYCPLCISFGFFNNTEINNQKSENIILKNGLSWSEDYYFGTKLLSNCQKMTFRLNKDIIKREDSTLKIAVFSKLHKLLSQTQKEELTKDYPFSIAIRISEIPYKNQLSGNLYNEIEAINTLEAIAEADLEAEV